MTAEFDAAMRLVEAMVFASADPVGTAVIARMLPDAVDADAVLQAVQARYAGRGVELVEVAGGWQFRTAPDLAPWLTKLVPKPRRLPRAAMEALAAIAYHQPATRSDVEEIRGANLGQATMDALLEAGLIEPKGRKEVPGRPTLWGTTPAFLVQFGLSDLRDLPRRQDLLREELQPEDLVQEAGAGAPVPR
jgi:segregation and condensation protein B